MLIEVHVVMSWFASWQRRAPPAVLLLSLSCLYARLLPWPAKRSQVLSCSRRVVSWSSHNVTFLGLTCHSQACCADNNLTELLAVRWGAASLACTLLLQLATSHGLGTLL